MFRLNFIFRNLLFVFLIIISHVSFSQETSKKWRIGYALEPSAALKIKGNYNTDVFGTDLTRDGRIFGGGVGLRFVVDYKQRFGIGFKGAFSSFSWNRDFFDKEMKNRMGEEYMELIKFSLYGSYINDHALNLQELNFYGYYILNTRKNYNFLIDVGCQLTSWRNPEYTFMTRTPSTNYYKIYQITNKRSAFKSMLNIGFSFLKKTLYENSPGKFRDGYAAVRLGFVYGPDYTDSYLIKIENERNDLTEINFDIPVLIKYFNLGVSFTFM